MRDPKVFSEEEPVIFRRRPEKFAERRRLLIILAIGAVLLTWGWFYGPAAMQQRGMDEAHALIRSVKPLLQHDPRFASVDFSVRTHPSLAVEGEVPDDEALAQLQSMVIASPDAHFHVNMRVKVARPSATEPAQ